MKKIVLSGEIGWEIWPSDVRRQISDANGGDIEVDLSSPGGFVFDGIEIFNMFRDHKRENPGSQMIMNIKSEAASMASYLTANEAFDLVTVEDNASWMVHNPLMGIVGDYQEMQKSADFLERLAKMMAPPYANRSGKTIEETRSMMDEEVWLFGKEIVDAGFADEIIVTGNKDDKSTSRARAELKVKNVMKKVKEKDLSNDDFEKAAALIKDYEPTKIQPQNTITKLDSIQPAAGGNNNNQEDVLMDLKELKAKHPELYAEIMNEGIKAGVDQEKNRVKNLLEMKKKKDFEGIQAIHNRIDEAIEKGENVQDVHTAISAMSMKDEATAAALDTNAIGDLNPGDSGTVSGETGEKKSDDSGEF